MLFLCVDKAIVWMINVMKTPSINKRVLIFLFSSLLVACGGGSGGGEDNTGGSGSENGGGDGSGGEEQVPAGNNIDEPKGIYNTGLDVLDMRVKVLPPEGDTCEVKKYDGCTLGDVLNDIERLDDFKPEVKVELTTSDGFSGKATLRQRGGSGRIKPVKSFRLKLSKDSTGKKIYWQGERRIQLIKTMGDATRMRHKLNYELFTEIDNLPSMRTRYVHLYISDKGEFNFDAHPTYDVLADYKETDLGVYLQVEYFGKEYLERRKWDVDSRVYKIEGLFVPESDGSYAWNDAFKLDAKGKPIDKDMFEKYVEIKRGKDHRAFVEMLKAVLNTSNDFNTDVLDKYFDRDNYIKWLAVNILSSNWDTRTNNYYFYNPKGTKKFYFVPWDYDNSYGILENYTVRKPSLPVPHWNTHALYWPYLLHRRFIEGSGNVAALKEKIIALRQTTYSNQNIKEKLEGYRQLVEPFILKSPDDIIGYSWLNEAGRKKQLKKYVDAIMANATTNYNNTIKYFDSPMTFIIGDAVQQSGLFKATWTPSYSVAGNTITYDLALSKTDDFKSENIVKSVTGLMGASYNEQLNLTSGTYYIRVIARDTTDPQNKWQLSNNLIRGGSYNVLGVKKVLIP